jgi:hypothetical protein
MLHWRSTSLNNLFQSWSKHSRILKPLLLDRAIFPTT